MTQKIEFDFSETPEARPFQQIEENIYPFEIREKAEVNEKGNWSLKLYITEGPYKGVFRYKTIATDLTSDEHKPKFMRTALVACGVAREKLSKKGVKVPVTVDTWKGKKGYFYYRPKMADEKYDVCEFVLPEDVADMKARFEGGIGSGGSTGADTSNSGGDVLDEQPAQEAAPKNGAAKGKKTQQPSGEAGGDMLDL